MSIIDCPALHSKGNGYPFGDKVPAKIRMLKTVTVSPMHLIGADSKNSGLPSLSLAGQQYPCWTNKYGAVAVVFPDGQKLGVKPHEFEVSEWHTN